MEICEPCQGGNTAALSRNLHVPRGSLGSFFLFMTNSRYDNLIDPSQTTALMKELGLGTKKRFGQNFLINKRVLDKIVTGAGITGEDTVLEIGPGIGTMTQALSRAAGRVIAVEIDADLIPVLTKTLAGFDNVTVVNADILDTDIRALTKDAKGPVKVVANLPYYITTPIIMKLLEEKLPIESITVMVQKEVAERMQAAPGGKDYGALSLAVQYYCDAEIIAKVPNCSFIPRPGVDSAVIRLTLKKDPQGETGEEDTEYMFRLIRAAFSQRRKTLANTLKNDPQLSISRERVEKALAEMDLPADIRGERLSLSDFARLSNILKADSAV